MILMCWGRILTQQNGPPEKTLRQLEDQSLTERYGSLVNMLGDLREWVMLAGHWKLVLIVGENSQSIFSI